MTTNIHESDYRMNAAITELLTRVSEVRKKHEMIADLTGERFNVFSILGLQSAENRTHSAFLRELLDPNGSHGLKDAFLKAFIRMLRKTHEHCEGFRLDGWDESQDLATKVETELHVGFKSEDLSQGGRIDLVITPKSGSRRILIENKIYAGDQECQLVRYHNHDTIALLLYLTLDGGDASLGSTQNEKSSQKLESRKHYFPISYKSDILAWLEECAKEASARPLVRETLVQYGHLIRMLTQQNSSNLMTQEITKTVLSSKESLLAYAELLPSWGSIRDTMIKSIEAKLNQIAVTEGFVSPKNCVDLNATKEQNILWADPLLENNNLGIGFGFEGGQWYYGFRRIELQNPAPEQDSLRNLLSLFTDADLPDPIAVPNDLWPASRWWPEIPQKLLWDLKLIGELYFEKTTNDDHAMCDSSSGFVDKVAILAKEMKRIAHEVFEGS